MSMKTSNRVVIEVDPAQKQKSYAELKARGLTMREWFLQQVSRELSIPQPTKPSRAPLKTHIRAEPRCKSAAPWYPNVGLDARRAS